MDRSLFSWVKRGKHSYQFFLVLAIFTLVFLQVLPLEIQKRLVNDVLSSGDFTRLMFYCLIYLGAVLCESVVKFIINSLQTLIGEQAMADMRQEMYRHILRLPLAFFRKTQPGTIVTSLITELATAGSFVGVAVAIPMINILSLLAFAGYLIWLDLLLGLVTLSIYPLVFLVLPMIQRRADSANKKRVDLARKMASQITESVTAVQEVHAQGSFRTEEQKYHHLVEQLLNIRIVWTLYKYAVKTTNNLILGLGPVIVFLLGGYLMMQGKMELGALVAFLSGQQKLYEPSKELIKFYQVYQDAAVRYKKVMHAFEGKTEFSLDQPPGGHGTITGTIELQDLDFSTPEGIKLLDQVNLKVEAGEHLALVGFSGSGKSTLAQCIGQICRHTGGQVLLDGHPVNALSKEEIVRSIGYISQEPVIFSGSVNENLLYAWNALNHYPASSKNNREPSLDDKMHVIQQAGLFIDVLRFGMNTIIDHQIHPDLGEALLRVRRNFQEIFGHELAEHVEFYLEDRYLHHSSVKENLIFGCPLNNDFGLTDLTADLTGSPLFLRFLDSCGLHAPLLETGADLLLQTVDILGDVPRETIFFTQTPLKPDEYDYCLTLAEKLQHALPGQIDLNDQHLLLDIALRFIPARHKITALQPLLEELILTGRKTLRTWSADNAPGAITFYSKNHYINSQSILNNIFFGNLTSNSPRVEERVNQCIVQLLIQEDLLERIATIGMDFEVGNRGDKLSGGQKQKLAIARVMLKQNGIVIMDEATSSLDNRSQTRIQKVVAKWRGQRTVISVIHRLDMLSSFDRVAVLKEGKIIECGTPETLLANRGALHELIHGKNN